MLILELWGISFHTVVVFALGKNFLFKSVVGYCGIIMAKLLLKERVLLYSSEFCLRELFNYNNCEKVKCDNNSKAKLLDDRTVRDL